MGKPEPERLNNFPRITQGSQSSNWGSCLSFILLIIRQDIDHCSHNEKEEPEAYRNEGQNSIGSVPSCKSKLFLQCQIPIDPPTSPDLWNSGMFYTLPPCSSPCLDHPSLTSSQIS